MISNVAAWIEGVAREGLTLHRSTPKSAPLPLIAKPVVVSPIKNINLDGNIAGLLAEPVLSVRTPRRFSLGVALGLPLLAGNLAAITVFFSPSLTHSVLSAALSSPVVSASFGSLFSGFSISGAAKDHEIESRLQRIKQYEGQLRLKASQIESVLRETSELDFDGISRSESRLRVTPSGVKGEHGGIGEGDGSLNWVLPGTPSKRDDLSALPQGSLAELVDSQVKKLRELPIGYPVEGDLSSGFGYRVSPFAQRIKIH